MLQIITIIIPNGAMNQGLLMLQITMGLHWLSLLKKRYGSTARLLPIGRTFETNG